MRNRSSAASRGDQQVLAAEGCSCAAAFKLAKRHDEHLQYCNKYYSMLRMTGAAPPLAWNRLLAALLYSGRPASIRSGTPYWGGNGRPGRPYGYGPAIVIREQIFHCVRLLLLYIAESLDSTISEAEVDTSEHTHSEIQLTEEVWCVYNNMDNILYIYCSFLFTVSSRNTNRKFR